ncbi:pyridoxamine 5'-phosphate oxidase family protein [Microbacteriaceae bacterium VKM Ac-2854]|nr:pyridoxamine 5'-phosphate oxidase family protein [Microbacteriaceae bacterium VKM Ac-2854]
MNREQILTLLNEDPFAQDLLHSHIPARLAYVALDGTPRAIPIAYQWNGASFILATPDIAPKVKALQANPAVALTIDTDTQPPVVLLVRGTAAVTFVDGVVPEFFEANRRMIPAEAWDGFEQQVTALYDRMARIEITPTWAKVLDFQTRAPETVMKLAAAKGM